MRPHLEFGKIRYLLLFQFGLLDVNWAPVILEMFTGRMDKLYIENHYFEGYLGQAESDLLMAV